MTRLSYVNPVIHSLLFLSVTWITHCMYQIYSTVIQGTYWCLYLASFLHESNISRCILEGIHKEMLLMYESDSSSWKIHFVTFITEQKHHVCKGSGGDRERERERERERTEVKRER